MMTRKGQSAMEYLMTYGWAILVIIIVIAVLFYIGVLNPRNVTPSNCTFPPGISCASYKLHAYNTYGWTPLELQIGQATGKSIEVTHIVCTQAQGMPTFDATVQLNASDITSWGYDPITIPPGESRWLSSVDPAKVPGCTLTYCAIDCWDVDNNSFTAANGVMGESYKGKIWIRYEEVGGLTRTVSGDLSTRFE